MRYKPRLEALEDRFLLSSFTWNWQQGNATTNWSDKNNWIKTVNDNNSTYPGENNHTEDTAKFDNTSNNNCTVNVSPTIAAINIANMYTRTITISGGQTLEVNGGPNMPYPTSSMAGGTIAGGGTFNVGDPSNNRNASFTWTGGQFNALANANVYGGMTMSGGNDKLLVQTFLNDYGFMTWQDSGNILLQNHSDITVEHNGKFWAMAAAAIKDLGGIIPSNFAIQQVDDNSKGLFVGSGGTTTMNVRVLADIGSYIEIQTGTLQMNLGSDLSGTIKIDHWVAPLAGTSLLLASADPKVDQLDGCSIDDAGGAGQKGNVTFVGGHVSVVSDSTIEVPVFDQASMVDGSGNLDIFDTYWWHSSGVWTGSGRTVIGLGAQLELDWVSEIPYQLGRTIDNWDTVTWSSSGRNISVNNGANIINENGGTFDVRVDDDIVNGGGAGTFQNMTGALLQKSAGTATTTIYLPFTPRNMGTIKQLSGRIKYVPAFLNLGTLIVAGGNGGMDFAGGFEQDGGSTSFTVGQASITVSSGNLVLKGGTVSTVTSGSDTISVTGQVQQSGGTVTVGMGSSITASDQYLESGGTIELTGGTVSATNAVQVSGGGILEGFGFVNGGSGGLTNSGTINPGDESGSAYNIYVTGNYTQTGSGVLNVAISGGSSATDDPLKVSGTATLGGTLDIILIGTAQAGTTLDVLYYAIRSGGFANIYVPSGWTWYYDDTQSPDGVYAKLTYNGPPH